MQHFQIDQSTPDLGDQRLSKRYASILKKATQQPQLSFPAICKNWHQTKALYRFFDHPRVTADKILAHHYQQTLAHLEQMDHCNDMLCLQDTSDLCYNHHPSKQDLGKMHFSIERGLRIHPTIAMTAHGINLGLIHAHMWTRDKDKTYKTAQQRRQIPLEEKESHRWITSYRAVCKVAAAFPQKTFFSIADRESDLYDLFLEATQRQVKNVYFLIRMAQNRNTTQHGVKLRTSLDKAPELGQASFRYKKTGGRHRLVKQRIKVRQVELSAPVARAHLPRVRVYALLAQEIAPPNGCKPIEWLLLTDYPIGSLKQAEKLLRYYTLRWEIETFFKVLKSGCKVEELRLETYKRLTAGLSLYMLVSCQIMLLLKLGRAYPELPSDILFSRYEIQGVYWAIHGKSPPVGVPSLGTIVSCIAQLGGYLNRKRDPCPGPKALWVGLQQLRTLALGFELAQTPI